MCNIKTFVGETKSMDEMLASGQAVSSDAMHEQQGNAMNPELARCGDLPECRGCTILFSTQVREVADRVAPKLRKSNLG